MKIADDSMTLAFKVMNQCHCLKILCCLFEGYSLFYNCFNLNLNFWHGKGFYGKCLVSRERHVRNNVLYTLEIRMIVINRLVQGDA